MPARVLIVEDEQLVAADLEVKLERLGYRVVGFATSGDEAIRLAQTEKPDLILMDIRLQGRMDGMEAARRIQAIAQAKVIFVSAFGQLARLNGGTPPPELCLTKPFSASQLELALASTLSEGLKAERARPEG